MKFAHLSDCHIGGWNESTLREINFKSFKKAIETSLEEKVDFILISGDLFDTALPSVDIMKETVLLLKKVKDNNIPVYIIPGSHDFSVSGKTMLDVIENAGLLHNVMRFTGENLLSFTTDKTGIKISGFYGKKGGLESSEYEKLIKDNLEKEPGIKIFMFHSLLTNLKNKKFELIDGIPVEYLPKNFHYYAGGHPHFVHHETIENYGIIAYPGPIFPNNFQELEELKNGGFYIVDIGEAKTDIKHVKLDIIPVDCYKINAENKSPMQVEAEIQEKIKNFNNKIITLRVEGCLLSGKTSDINFKSISEKFQEAYCFLKNTNKLSSKELENIEIEDIPVESIEEKIIEEAGLKSKFRSDFIKKTVKMLDKEKIEGEKNSDFELRIIKEAEIILEL